jgi:Fe-S oxidoreductase
VNQHSPPTLYLYGEPPLSQADVSLLVRWLQLAEDLSRLLDDCQKEHAECEGCMICHDLWDAGKLLKLTSEPLAACMSSALDDLAHDSPRAAPGRPQEPEARRDDALYLHLLTSLHETMRAVACVRHQHDCCAGCPLCVDAAAVGFTLAAFADRLRSSCPPRVLADMLEACTPDVPHLTTR